MTRNVHVQVVVPSGFFGASANDDMITGMVRSLADRLSLDPDREWSSKYGTNYEDDRVMMHRFCWCEKGGCAWCGDMQAPNLLIKKTGLEVRWYKYIGRSMEYNRQFTADDMAAIAEIANAPREAS